MFFIGANFDLTFLDVMVYTILCFFGGLSMDIDSTKSKPRRALNISLIIACFGVGIYASLNNKLDLLTILLVIVIIVVWYFVSILKHRGVLHSFWFILVASLFWAGLCWYFGVALYAVSGWLLGSIGHLFLDDWLF